MRCTTAALAIRVTAVNAAPMTSTVRCAASASAIRKITHTAAPSHSPANAITLAAAGFHGGVGRPVQAGGGIDHVVVQHRRRQRTPRRDPQQFTVGNSRGAQGFAGRQYRPAVDAAQLPEGAPLVAVSDVCGITAAARFARAHQLRQLGQECGHRNVCRQSHVQLRASADDRYPNLVGYRRHRLHGVELVDPGHRSGILDS